MNFLEKIFARLRARPDAPILQEVRGAGIISATGSDLLRSIHAARSFFAQRGLRKGDRCVVLAHNSIHWAALDLALMAEGILVVPLYSRQVPQELVEMIKDCSASLICCGDERLRDAVAGKWPDAPPVVLFDEIFAQESAGSGASEPLAALADSDPVTIIYTSGTSGQPKGVILNAGNLNHILRCTADRLDVLMGAAAERERVFHYLSFCFAASWIFLLTCLSRNTVLALSTDLTKLGDEIRLAAAQYFLNVPAVLERMRNAVEEELRKRGGIAHKIFRSASSAWLRRHAGEAAFGDSLWLALARLLIFPAIRRKIVPQVKALICGSAPLAEETQLFFMMIGLPVLQGYGLTETTGICTLDHPYRVEPGRVGPAISGIEMKLGEQNEILARGPNIFPGYWSRPEETARVLRDGWFHTGDQGEVSDGGNWLIIGRLKNLIILSSGHNVAPEPVEELILRSLPGAQQVMVLGDQRSYLAALITVKVTRAEVQATLERINQQFPHYKRIHAFHLLEEPFSIENGLLAANGKLRREAIAARLRAEIEALYRREVA
jgi:long-chain acyl-CoA synthetase